MAEPDRALAPPGGRVRPLNAQSPGSAVLVVVAVVIVLFVVVWWLADRGVSHGDERLYETTWVLESASLDGAAVDVVERVPSTRWTFDVYMNDGDPNFSDTPVIGVDHGCDAGRLDVDLEKSSGRWTEYLGYTPSRSCIGDLKDVMNVLLLAQEFRYAISEDRLRVASSTGDAVLIFRADGRLDN